MRSMIFCANEESLLLLGTDNEFSMSEYVSIVTPYGIEASSPAFDILQAIPARVEFEVIHSLEEASNLQINKLLLVNNEKVSCGTYSKIVNAYIKTECKIYVPIELQRKLSLPPLENISVLHKEDFEIKVTGDEILHVDIPVIAVTGIGQNTNKLPLTLLIKDHLSSLGYNTLTLSSSPLAELWGMEALPNFLFSEKSFRDKTMLFNHFLYSLASKTQPELIIISIPGGISPLNPFCYEDYYEMAMIISNATQISIDICSLYCQDYPDEFLDLLDDINTFRFGCKPLFYHSSNVVFDLDAETRKNEFIKANTSKPVSFVKDALSDSQRDNIFTMFDKDMLSDALKRIVSYLIE
ncbi:hypothetical protein D1841_14960 [Neglecta sp. X4]|uniref:hypothetical protein n=1 Tax=unclassified Neglectibacter TaxID=2632164 RepID=UPI00136EE081|nr:MULTISPECIES: hypothetical protein [unclassified Neglectibacter]NBI18893.1 hypothetical protein [Neglectibacter sp. 59]NBJ74512.1 hypothetical protein [Neglectibacter sp. X4]NCE82345.1 hypothetical protein [Neglectibacter sp. X58]